MIYQIAIILSLLGNFFQEPTPAAGIYIIDQTTRRTKCVNEIRMVIGKQKICLSPKPLIGLNMLRPATDVLYDPVYKTHYIEMGLTPDASRILLQTRKSLPGVKFALAANDEIICIFVIREDYGIKVFRIGEDVPLSTLNIIHERLEQANL